jgi:hypothetical protein
VGNGHAEADASYATAATASSSVAKTSLTIPPSLLLLRADQIIE